MGAVCLFDVLGAVPILAIRHTSRIKRVVPHSLVTLRFNLVLNSYLPIMFKLSVLFAILTILLQVSAVVVHIPFFPDVYDTNATYVQGRCIDYCAFLRPDQICPRNPLDATCLCYVYDIRLPAV